MINLLDTDHLSLWQRGGAEGVFASASVSRITTVTYAEQVRGWLAAVARAQVPETEVTAFREMQQSLPFCAGFAIWGFTLEAARLCENLKGQKLRVGAQDLRIASIALPYESPRAPFTSSRATAQYQRTRAGKERRSWQSVGR